jgi:plastocyanin
VPAITRRLLTWVAVGLALVALSATSFGTVLAKDGGRTIEVVDDCNPKLFPPGLCNPKFDGEIGIAQLLAFITAHPKEVLRERDALDWKFDPASTGAKSGALLTAVSKGGEFHTFTCVTHFGGGVVEQLNAPLGLSTDLAVPCSGMLGAAVGASALPAGQSATFTFTPNAQGIEMFQCLIHPWMRTVVKVDGK